MAACHIAHAALKADPARWAALAYVGQQVVDATADEPVELLELRDCTCGSTLAKVIAVGEAAVCAREQPPKDARLLACLECAQPCPPGHRICAVCAPERVITALAKCAAALCFAEGGPRLDALTARLTRGAAPSSATFADLVERGWIEWRGAWRLSKRGTEIFVTIHGDRS